MIEDDGAFRLSTFGNGDGALGGAVNFVTRREFQGIEIDAGGQATDKFDQHEEDVTLTVGAGTQTTGLTAMISFFTRGALAASDRDTTAPHRRERILFDRQRTLISAGRGFQII